MLTGLVYAAVVILWAVVLVPQWLRRHDRNAEHRTTLNFHRAMRTLERRRTTRGVSRASHDVDVTVAGARTRVHDRTSMASGQSKIDQHLDLGVDPFIGGVQEEQLHDARVSRARTHARETAARRRRQVQQSLIGLSIISFVLLAMGVVPLLLAALSPVGLGVFWFASRQQTQASMVTAARRQRRDEARASTRGASSDRATMGDRTDETGNRVERDLDQTGEASRGKVSSRRSSGATRDRRSARRHVDRTVASRQVNQAPIAAGASDTPDVRMLSDEQVAVRRAGGTSSGEWEPVESPLPSYVTGTRATAIPRNLDSTERGNWTAERMMEQVNALRTPGADAESELGLDTFVDVPGAADEQPTTYEHRRAVND